MTPEAIRTASEEVIDVLSKHSDGNDQELEPQLAVLVLATVLSSLASTQDDPAYVIGLCANAALQITDQLTPKLSGATVN